VRSSTVSIHAIAIVLAAFASPAHAQAEQDGADTSGDIIVTGSRYRGEVSSGGARIDADVRDLPISITVLPEELIDDRAIINLRQLADNVAGVRSRRSGSGEQSIDFSVRGFQGFAGGIAVNGFRVDGFSAAFDPVSIERVEFLKGPASVLYGASGSVAGLVNLVTKTPQRDAFLDADIGAGSYGFARASLDANAPLSSTLSARLAGAVGIEDNFRTFTPTFTRALSPSIRWDPTSTLSFVAEAHWTKSKQSARDAYSYPDIGALYSLPKRFRSSERGEFYENEGWLLRGEANWEVTPSLTLRQAVLHQAYDDRELAIGPAFRSEITPGTRLLTRFASPGASSTRTTASQTEARWNVATGPIEHRLLFGFEYFDTKQQFECCDQFEIDPIDIDNPVYGAVIPPLANTEFGGNLVETKAFYAQTFSTLGPLRILAGLRWDDTTAISFFCSDPTCAGGFLPPSNERALSPRLGLVYEPATGTQLFVSWSRSFVPNVFTDRFGATLPPEYGDQYEAGVRQDILPDRRLTLSATVFQITRSNVAETDPVDDNFSVAIGEQRVKGVEVELTGRPVDWLDLVATYSHQAGKVTRSNSAVTGILEGSALPEAVPHAASLFARADLSAAGLTGVSLSGGIYYTSDRPTRSALTPVDPTTTELPGNTRVDLGAFWDVSDQLRVQVNVTNLFDALVLEPVNRGFNRVDPRRFSVTARVRI
jgi:iron complex outermembrane receptor protein